MNAAAIVIRAVGGLLDTIKRLVESGDNKVDIEDALMKQAEATKARLDELKFEDTP